MAQYLRPAGASSYTGLAVSTLAAYRQRGGGPPFIRRGRAVLYAAADLDAWMTAGRQAS